MFERIRFVRYALQFERAFKSDRWDDVKACFHPDAVYAIEGSGTRFDGVFRGPDAIAAAFKQMLDEVDRKFDKREPRLRGWVSVRGGELTLPWKVRYTIGDKSAWLTGTSKCRWSGGKIISLGDTMIGDEVRHWAELVGAA